MVNVQQPRKISKINFGLQTHTAFGGMKLVSDLVSALQVPELIDELVRVKKRERGYRESESILSLAYSALMGGECLDDMNVWRAGATQQQVLNLTEVPHATTCGDFLRMFHLGNVKQLKKAIRQIRRNAYRQTPKAKLLIFDMDSTLQELFGSQDGASMGYNGIYGLHPLCSFRADTGELIGFELRRGSAHTAGGADVMLKESIAALQPQAVNLYWRGDSGFYNKALLAISEERGVFYSVTADQTRPLRQAIAALPEKAWHRHRKDAKISYAEFRYTITGSTTERRYLVKRTEKEPETQEQLELSFPEVPYQYHVMVTNRAETDLQMLYQQHQQHAVVEKHIEELKNGFGLDGVPTARFCANSAWCHIIQLAYNLFVYLKHLALPQSWRSFRIKNIRFRLFAIVGRVVHRARQWVLNLCRSYPYQDVFVKAESAIAALRL